MELSNLKNYTNARAKIKKVSLFIAFASAAIIGTGAFLQIMTDKRVLDTIYTQRMLKQFNNFDLTKLLNKIPDDKVLTSCLDSSLKKINLGQAFDESKVTKADIFNLLRKHTYSDFVGDSYVEELAQCIANDAKVKHCFNNLLSLASENGFDKINYHNVAYFFKNKNINADKEQIDIIFKIFKKNNPKNAFKICENHLKEALDNVDSVIKIERLSQYLNKNCLNAPHDFNKMLKYKENFNDFCAFISSLRKGNAKGCLYGDSDFDLKIAAKFFKFLK